MTIEQHIAVLRRDGYNAASNIIESLTAELEQAKQERDAAASCIERIRTSMVADMYRADELRQYVYAVARAIHDWEHGGDDNA